jgi:hypothetical protein
MAVGSTLISTGSGCAGLIGSATKSVPRLRWFPLRANPAVLWKQAPKSRHIREEEDGAAGVSARLVRPRSRALSTATIPRTRLCLISQIVPGSKRNAIEAQHLRSPIRWPEKPVAPLWWDDLGSALIGSNTSRRRVRFNHEKHAQK